MIRQVQRVGGGAPGEVSWRGGAQRTDCRHSPAAGHPPGVRGEGAGEQVQEVLHLHGGAGEEGGSGAGGTLALPGAASEGRQAVQRPHLRGAQQV